MNQEFSFGRGKISAVIALFLSILSFGAVLCFIFPDLFITKDLQALYPLKIIRVLIDVCSVLSIVFAFLGLILGYHPKLPLLALLLSFITALLGGGSVKGSDYFHSSYSLSLDWLLLDVLILSIIFIPLERMFPLKDGQRIFRHEIKTDLLYFVINHILFQFLSLATAYPTKILQLLIGEFIYQNEIKNVNIIIQVFAIFIVMDFFQYWVHRLFHKIPRLWRVHAIHHSSLEMDWIAGSRLHLFDVLATRTILYFPLYYLGFSTRALEIYLVIAAFQTVFIHANLKFRFDFLNFLIVTPAYHHWHHASDRPALDKNFCVHFPLFDLLFGTYYSPKGEWPKNYGVYKEQMPANFWQQFLYPFKKKGTS